MLWASLFIVLPFGPLAQKACAQETTEADGKSAKERDFYFVYIDHEPSTPSTLVEKLDEVRSRVLDNEDILIIYMANGDEPIVSFTNVKDPDPGMHRDSSDAYNDIIDELQSAPFHEASINDADHISKIIGKEGAYPLFNEQAPDDPIIYRTVTFRFFVGEQFWFKGYNEEVIARLYEKLNLNKHMKFYVRTVLAYEMWRSKDIKLPNEDFGSPRFGRHNIGGINDNQKIRFHGYPD